MGAFFALEVLLHYANDSAKHGGSNRVGVGAYDDPKERQHKRAVEDAGPYKVWRVADK